jgi:2-succinyl-5-enolpyruvyl-6-hydroxy-3-cyclohexene-1-carboxylate synthase
LAARSTVPLVIVVIQNQGGRIFEQLPLASTPDLEPGILDSTITPHTLSFEQVATMFGVQYACIEQGAVLERELGKAYARAECTLLEVVVPPRGAAAQQKRLLAAVDAAFAKISAETTA